MALLLFANLAQSTLAGGITSTSTTANLASGTGSLFPQPASGEYFCLTFIDAATGLLNEIVHVTNVTGDVITMVRGQEGTTARAWLAGDLAKNLWTAGSAARMIQVAQLQEQAGNYAADTGAVNALVITLDPVPSSLASIVGSPIRVKINHTNTGSATLNVNGLGAKAIVNADSTAISANQLIAGGIYTIIWNGTAFNLQTSAGYHAGSAVFTTSGTFVVPAGVYLLRRSRLWSGGGGGGTSSTAIAGSGGGGGALCEQINVSVTPGTNMPVVIGAGGAGGSGSGPGSGGGSSSFNGMTATGGGGGTGSNTGLQVGGAGGVASGGTLNINGGRGSAALPSGNQTGGVGGSAPAGGPGGATSSSQPSAGVTPGGGGGGGGSSISANGGAGAPGMCVIEW